jgi:hypothetical protein
MIAYESGNLTAKERSKQSLFGFLGALCAFAVKFYMFDHPNGTIKNPLREYKSRPGEKSGLRYFIGNPG